MLLYRPVGLEEMRLIYEADMRAFPARLPDQPIFYPVTNDGYARQIARDWNTKSGTLAGFVTRFAVDDGYVSRFERRVVGGREHEELWVPAEELAEFNGHIKGPIEVVASYFGEGFTGYVPDQLDLKGKDVKEQLVELAQRPADSSVEVSANHVAAFLGFFFWEQHNFSGAGIDAAARDRVLAEVRRAWASGGRRSIVLGAARAP
jgi:hypothetical protein